MKLVKALLVTVAVVAASGFNGAWSAGAPALTGVVNQTPSKSNPTIVIDDLTYNVTKSVVVKRSATATMPISQLRAGQKIQFVVVGEAPGKRGTVTEILVTP